jgi:alkylated DNA repair dioxygenase AlkB
MNLFMQDNVELLPYDFGAVLHSDVWVDDDCQTITSRLSHELDWAQVFVEVFNRRVAQPRLTCWYGDSGKNYSYSGTHLEPLQWTGLLSEIKQKAEALSGVAFNSVLGNLYRTGSDGISWHSDNEPELGLNPTIASVTFGAARRFDMRHRETKEIIHIDLTPGSILVMSGESQSKWQHQIAKTKKLVAPRVNLTFRTIHV